jgi:hypothetical protein
MGFRFRKSISLGGRGFGITGGTSGLKFNAGLPGTGLSFSRKIVAVRRSSGSRLGTLIIVIFVTGLISRGCGIQNQESATNLPKSETSLRKGTTSQAGESGHKYADDPGGVAVRFNHQALEIADCEDGLASCKPEVAAKLRAALERRARELDWQIRCKPTEYRDAQGLRYLKYGEPDCAGRSLN